MVKLVVYVVALCILCSSSAMAGEKAPFDDYDTALYLTGLTLSAIDCMQTYHIMTSDKYTEINPIINRLGPSGVFPYFFVGQLTQYCIARYMLEGRARKIFLGATAGLSLACVVNNQVIGVKLVIPFKIGG
jgi:hypothetical protein